MVLRVSPYDSLVQRRVFGLVFLQRNFVDIIPLSIGVTFDMGLSYGRPRMCVKKPHAYSCSTNKELSSLFFPRENVGVGRLFPSCMRTRVSITGNENL